MKHFQSIISLTSLIFISLLFACDKEDDSNPKSDSKVLLIQNGATSLGVGNSEQFRAILISAAETKDVTSIVSWKISGSTDQEGMTISASGVLQVNDAVSNFAVEASLIDGGTAYSAKVPVTVVAPSSVLVVNPAVLLADPLLDNIPIVTFYLGKGTPSYTFSSSNAAVATVSTSGTISIKGAGTCVITVKANGVEGTPSFDIPVMIVGETIPADLPLPVTKIEITPSFSGLFVNETQTFTAKALNSKGEEVVPSGGFAWELITVETDDPDDDEQVIGTFSANGKTGSFTANKATGRGYVKVTAAGITAKAEIIVVPKNVLFVNPPVLSLAPGASQSLQLETYEMDKNTGFLKPGKVNNPAGVKWMMLGLGEQFSIGSVDAAGKVTIKNDAMPGMIDVVTAYLDDANYYPGGSAITVALTETCDCGTAVAGATTIDVNTNAIQLSLSTGNISAARPSTIKNSAGASISNAKAVYCSSNQQAVSVNSDGTITAMGAGTATITVCHGNLSKTISVTVSF